MHIGLSEDTNGGIIYVVDCAIIGLSFLARERYSMLSHTACCDRNQCPPEDEPLQSGFQVKRVAEVSF
ncbi:MAG: hypothetical protein JW989_01240 [Chlorobiaceae bacterium]|nr:hypothetical protein [Chlorobiaceae bacterium]